MIEKEKHIYKALKPFTFGLIPARSKVIIDGSGNTRVGAPTKGVKIVFTDGTFEVNEITAASYTKPNGTRYTIKSLVKALEEHPLFGSRYKKVFDSNKTPTEEQVAFKKKADASNTRRSIAVSQGARAKKG